MMGLETLTVRIVGTRPLLMHNGRLADPTNEYMRQLKQATDKNRGKAKTDATMEDVKRLEWLGGLYTDDKNQPCLTEDMVLGCLVEGARKSKLGKQATAGVLGAKPFFPLTYNGPKDLLELYATGKFCDFRGAVISGRRIMRSRPMFSPWSADLQLLVDPSIIDASAVITALKDAGNVVGLGDFRPRFGRFEVEC